MKKFCLFVIVFSVVIFAATAASKDAPSPVTATNAPQFIVLGSDDNTKAEGIKWMQDVIDNIGTGKNKNGSKRYMSFYVNTDQNGAIWDGKNDLVDAAYNAYKAGHEVGNHTSTHLYIVEFGDATVLEETGVDNGKRASKETIKAEIERVQNVLVSAGIPKQHQFGFRTPYLRYSDSVFTVIKELGFLYDCSINAADDNSAGDNYWPYTLDSDDGSGNFAPDNSADKNSWGKTSPISKHEGLWELPCARFAIDPDDMDYVKGVLDDEDFDGYITGLDYNLWWEAQLDSGQTVRSLMHTLEQSLAGNRAPLTIGVHSQYYFEAKNSEFPKIPQEKRRQAFEEFVKKASQIENVFFVSGDMLVRWMQNPVSAAEFNPENYKRAPFTTKTAPTKIRLSNSSVDQGVLEVGTLTAVNLNEALTHTFSVVEGGDKFEIVNGNILKFKSALTPNTTSNNKEGYSVRVRAEASEGAGSVEGGFTVWVDEIFNTDINYINSSYDWEGWSNDDSYNSHAKNPNPNHASNTGSDWEIKSQYPPLEATLTVGRNKIVNGNTIWPSVEVSTSYDYALTGLREIIVTYTSDKEVNLGIGKWTAQMAFGFAATLPEAKTEKTVTVTLDQFDMTYSEYNSEANRAKVPGSIKDALGITGLSISFSGIDEGTTTNIKVTSLRFLGIPNKATPQKTSISQISKKPERPAITFTGISSNKLNLNIAKPGVYQVDIFTVNGKRLFSQKMNFNSGRNSVPVKGIAKGVAILRVSGLNANIEQKLMIK